MTHTTLGHDYFGCILSVQADQQTWKKILHQRVTPLNAFRNFTNRVQAGSDGRLKEVLPLHRPSLPFDEDQELILHNVDPLKFEVLVKDLMSAMGYEATLTKASHDGGIDVEAVNPAPIVGGKVIVQCKRYGGTVGASVVRDLFGVTMSERATKGILITTSDFSPDAYNFAKDKPVELINGSKLAELLRQYGVAIR
jgi:restriction system protein